MSVIIYKCTVCKREKEFLENKQGLEVIKRCTITKGCRGELVQTKKYENYNMINLPTPVKGLEDWFPRKILYNHTQLVSRTEWLIKHNLGTAPAVSVYVNIPTTTDPNNLEEVLPQDIIYVDENTIKLIFNDSYSGIAQLFARQASPNDFSDVQQELQTTQLTQVSYNYEMNIALSISEYGACDTVELEIEYNTTKNTIVRKTYIAERYPASTQSPWNDYDKVIVRAKSYIIYSFVFKDATFNENDIPQGSTLKITKIGKCGSPATPTEINGKNKAFILYANEPFDNIDKELNSYIDLYNILISEEPKMVYNSELFVTQDSIQKIYPPLKPIN